MNPVKQTEQTAAEWLTRRDSGNWSPRDQIALDEWLNESTGNIVAFVRLEYAWTRADRYKALGAGFPPGRVPTPDEFNLSPFFAGKSFTGTRNGRIADCDTDAARGTVKTHGRLFRAFRAPRAFAASVAVALMAAAAWFSWPVGPDYKTPVGGTASVPMADGSRVTLNTDSAIRVALTDEEREVSLDHGEAFFEVAHDPARPFVVRAGNKRVIAVGTKFSVRRIGDDIRVFVTEGKVRLQEDERRSEIGPRAAAHSSGSPHLHPTGEQAGEEINYDPTGEILLAAGGVARTDGDGILVQERPLAEVEESLSWRTGYIIFHESTLADAVAEFNRYNVRKIIIEDPGISRIKLSGNFRTTDSEAFVRLIEGGFSLRVRPSGSRIVLTKN